MAKHLLVCKKKAVIVVIEPGIYIMALLLGVPGGQDSEAMLEFLRDFVPENGALTQHALRHWLSALYRTKLLLLPLKYYGKMSAMMLQGKNGIDLQKALQSYVLEDSECLFTDTHDETAFKDKVRPLVLVKRMLMCQRFHCEWQSCV